jgi:hypothetical protein
VLRVIRSVTILNGIVSTKLHGKQAFATLTRLSKVLRFPIKMVSPSTKYA